MKTLCKCMHFLFWIGHILELLLGFELVRVQEPSLKTFSQSVMMYETSVPVFWMKGMDRCFCYWQYCICICRSVPNTVSNFGRKVFKKKSYKHDLLRLAVGNLLASFIQSWKKRCFILHLMIVAAASVNLVRMQGKVLSLLGMDCSNLWAWCENFSSVQALGIFLVLWNTGILMKQSRTHFNWAESELARERRVLCWVLHPAKLCFPTTSWWLCCVLVTFLHRAH